MPIDNKAEDKKSTNFGVLFLKWAWLIFLIMQCFRFYQQMHK